MLRVTAGVSLALSAAAQIQTCAQGSVYNGNGVTYDLSSLAGAYGFRLRDLHNNSVDPLNPEDSNCIYDYWFSVCNDMDPPSSPLTPQSACQTTTGSDGTTISGRGPAWQVVSASTGSGCGPNCHRLGSNGPSGVLMPMFSGNNPARGVSLQYTGGDNCTVTVAGGVEATYPRAVHLDFACYDSHGLVPQYDEIFEDVDCVYHAIIYTPAGCPLQCQRGNAAPFRLCSGNGICNYDNSKSTARCFCNQGWSGAACDQPGDKGLPPAKSYSGNIAGGFFGGLFGGIILVLAAFFAVAYFQHKPLGEAVQLHIGGGGSSSGGDYSAAPADSGAVFSGAAGASTVSSYAPPVAESTGSAFGNDGPLLA